MKKGMTSIFSFDLSEGTLERLKIPKRPRFEDEHDHIFNYIV